MRKQVRREREVKGATATATEHRAFVFRDLKTTNDNAGTFEGYVSVFGNLDLNGDIVDRGAFKKTLADKREVKQRTNTPYLFPILWQHDEHMPIGGFTDAYEDEHGLFIKGELDLDVPQGQQAYSGMKKGYLRGLSIGYDTVKSMYDSAHTRHLLEVRLWEGSPVTFPANTDAGVLNVKSAVGKTDWPLADRDTAWDGGAANDRLVEWAGGKDKLDVAKFKSVHMYFDDKASDPHNLGAYKFPFCDVIGGSVKAVPKAIESIAGILQGAMGGAKLGGDDDAIKAKVATYYGKMRKQFDDESIQVPWSAKALSTSARKELKDLTGLSALTGTAVSLDNIADGAECLVDCLAQSCGMALEGGGTVGKPEAPVAALLAGVDGLEAAVKAVITSWQDFSQQTDALLVALGLPDNDDRWADTAVPMYMSQLRSAFELKVGRQLSQGNRDRIMKVATGLQAHASELKAVLTENDNPNRDENDQGADYGDLIASGQHNPKGGKAAGREGTGQEPASTTPSATAPEPANATLETIQATLLAQSLEAMRPVRAQ